MSQSNYNNTAINNNNNNYYKKYKNNQLFLRPKKLFLYK